MTYSAGRCASAVALKSLRSSFGVLAKLARKPFVEAFGA